jgi:hypothetical protein
MHPIAWSKVAAAHNLSFVFLLALVTADGCSNRLPQPAESVRLHDVALLYGKYLTAHNGQMPASRDELVRFADSNEHETLRQRGYLSADDVFCEQADDSRIIVLYRDLRERLQTEFVAIEERKLGALRDAGSKISSKWFATGVQGPPQEIDEQQARRVLIEAG